MTCPLCRFMAWWRRKTETRAKKVARNSWNLSRWQAMKRQGVRRTES